MLALLVTRRKRTPQYRRLHRWCWWWGSSELWGWIDRWLCGWWWCFVGISQQKQFNWFNRSLNWRGLNEDYLFLISFPSAELHSSRRSSVWPRKWAPTQWANDIGSFVFLPTTTTIVLFLCSCCWPRSFLLLLLHLPWELLLVLLWLAVEIRIRFFARAASSALLSNLSVILQFWIPPLVVSLAGTPPDIFDLQTDMH